MKKLLLLSFLSAISIAGLSAAGLSGCASSKSDRGPMSVTFIRAGGFSGLEDRYTIASNGHTIKTMRFPNQEERAVADTTLSSDQVAPIFSYLDRNMDTLLALKLDESGNMTTTMILQYGKRSHVIRWPNLEPPILSTTKLDSLYELVAPVQQWLSPAQ